MRLDLRRAVHVAKGARPDGRAPLRFAFGENIFAKKKF